MSGVSGFPSNQKVPLGTGITNNFATVIPTDPYRNALETPRFAFRVSSAVIPRTAGASTGIELSSDGSKIFWVYDTATPAQVGDFVRFESGDAVNLEIPIVKVDTNKFALAINSGTLPSSGDTFYIMRYATQRVNDDGTQLVSITPTPIAFVKNAVDTEVNQDTVTPGNSIPLPVAQLNTDGTVHDPLKKRVAFMKDGSEVVVNEDTVTPSNNIPLPVKITSATGPINITAGDFNVQLSDQGVNADVTRIGDGTTQLGITLSNEAKVSDATAQATLSNISTQQLGAADAGNSSTTPLAGGAVFTGAAIDIKDYSAIHVAAISDVASATNGLSMQFSPDGTNWDHVHAYDVAASTGVSYAQATELRYFRIVYTNGAAAQTYFRLTTVLKRGTVSPSRYTVSQPVTGTLFADVTKSIIHGETTSGGGSYVAVKVSPSGALTVDSTVTSSVLPNGAATEATLASIAAEDFATQTTLAALNAKVSNDYGVSSGAVRTAAQVGNASGVADFGTGVAGAQTLRTVLASDSVINTKPSRSKVDLLYNDYSSTNVTTAAYTQLIASTSAAATKLEIFDSSGEAMILAVGAAASEVDQLYIFPGGNGSVELSIPASSRISIKAKTATASTGFIAINLYS